MQSDFLKIVRQYQRSVEKELERFFDGEIKNAHSPFLLQTLQILKEYSLRPAKRIRAVLINCGYRIIGGKDAKTILRASISIELIHNFLLAHDDIIDRGKTRRGGQALHYSYQEQSRQDKEHYGLSMAIAAGDMLDILGRKILAQTNVRAKHNIKALEKLDDILQYTIYGEMLEVWLKKEMAAGKKIKESDVLDVYKNKTAFYTFVGPLQIGALLAGADEKSLKLFEKIGLPMGIAFQLQDDIDDLFLENASDIQEGQPNLLITRSLAGKQGKILKKYLGKGALDKKDREVVREAVRESGAYDSCLLMAQNLIDDAKKNIIASPYPEKEKEFLLDLSNYIIKIKK